MHLRRWRGWSISWPARRAAWSEQQASSPLAEWPSGEAREFENNGTVRRVRPERRSVLRWKPPCGQARAGAAVTARARAAHRGEFERAQLKNSVAIDFRRETDAGYSFVDRGNVSRLPVSEGSAEAARQR